jgi:hypothetical protein
MPSMIKEELMSDAASLAIMTTLLLRVSVLGVNLGRGERFIDLRSLIGSWVSLCWSTGTVSPLAFFFLIRNALRGDPEMVLPY